MFDRNKIDAVISQLMAALPSGLLEAKNEIEKNFRAVLQTTFTKLDLVTREEFEVQTKVLERTRQKLAALEAKLK